PGPILGDGVVVRSEVMAQEVLVPLGARLDRVAAPDEPYPRPALLSIGIIDRKAQLLVFDLLDDARDDVGVGLGAGAVGLGHDVEGVLVEVRREGHPAHAYRLCLEVHRVALGPARVRGCLGVFSELLLIAPLTAMGVVPGGRLHHPRRLAPVERHGDRIPGCNGGQLFLADVVVDAAAIDSTAAAQDQRNGGRAVAEIVVVKVVGAGTHDDHGLAESELRVAGKLARKPDRGLATDAGMTLLPRRRVRSFRVVVARRVGAVEAAAVAKLGHQKVEAGGDHNLATVGGETLYRYAARKRLVGDEIVEPDLHDSIRLIDEAQHWIDGTVVQAVLRGQVPLAMGATPAIANLALEHARLAALGIEHQHLPVAVFDALVALQMLGAQQPPHAVSLSVGYQFDQERKIGVALDVVDEIWDLAIEVEFLEDDVIDGHPQRRVLSRLDRDPLV